MWTQPFRAGLFLVPALWAYIAKHRLPMFIGFMTSPQARSSARDDKEKGNRLMESGCWTKGIFLNLIWTGLIFILSPNLSPDIYGRAGRGERIKFRAAHPVRCFELTKRFSAGRVVSHSLPTAHCCHGIDMCGLRRRQKAGNRSDQTQQQNSRRQQHWKPSDRRDVTVTITHLSIAFPTR